MHLRNANQHINNLLDGGYSFFKVVRNMTNTQFNFGLDMNTWPPTRHNGVNVIYWRGGDKEMQNFDLLKKIDKILPLLQHLQSGIIDAFSQHRITKKHFCLVTTEKTFLDQEEGGHHPLPTGPTGGEKFGSQLAVPKKVVCTVKTKRQIGSTQQLSRGCLRSKRFP